MDAIRRLRSRGEKHTQRLGHEFASEIAPGAVVSFNGELGSGKTVFIRGMCEVLCPGITISSPSFTLINTYPGKQCDVHHIDLYRIDTREELSELGLEDYLYSGDITLIEWGEKLEGTLPEEAIGILISITGDMTREIEISH